jgi:hypothetical protein
MIIWNLVCCLVFGCPRLGLLEGFLEIFSTTLAEVFGLVILI